jgi:hypothetical protein
MDWKLLDKVKVLAIQGLVSDDDLMEKLVLKGGNAIDLIHNAYQRGSLDLDFSIEDDFQDIELRDLEKKVKELLERSFQEAHLVAHDVHLTRRPSQVPTELASFWGGYRIEFKVLPEGLFNELSGDVEAIRRNSLAIGRSSSTVFRIEISSFEYCREKRAHDVGGFTVFVYSPVLIVVEKLRAICQQMEQYRQIVPSMHPAARARDFFDIHSVVKQFGIDLSDSENIRLLKAVFDAKRVPTKYLSKIPEYREFHRPDFAAVKDTVKPGVTIRDYDFYFDYVISICPQL